jgi:hypothetical protein
VPVPYDAQPRGHWQSKEGFIPLYPAQPAPVGQLVGLSQERIQPSIVKVVLVRCREPPGWALTSSVWSGARRRQQAVGHRPGLI